MAIKKSYRRWLLAALIIVVIIFIIEWLISLNRNQSNSQEKNTMQNGVTK